MLSIACLPANTQLVQDLKDIVEYLAYERAGSKRPAGIMDVYNDIRQSGIEIDLKSIAYIYADTLPLDEAAFDDLNEIDELVGRPFANMLKNVIRLTPRQENKQIGELSQEEWISERLANAFYGAHTTKVVNQTDMVVMQNALLKGIKKLLGKLPKEPKTEKDYKEIIGEVMAVDGMGQVTLSGMVNNIRDVFEAAQQEIKRYSAEIGKSGDAALQAKWEDYMREAESATYNLLFSKAEAKKVLTDIMKEAGFAKKSGTKNIIDWNKLAGEINDVNKLRNNASAVLLKEGYRPDTVDAVVNALEQEFNDMFAETMMRADKELTVRQNRLGGNKSQTKQYYQKLGELYNLGIFKGAHDKLLYSMLGVDNLTRADISAIEDVAKNIAELSREVKGKDYTATYAFQQFQHKINLIVARNITKKSTLMKIMGVLDKYFQVLNFGRIANVFNSAQNNYSGFKEMAAVNEMVIKELGIEFVRDHNLFAAIWKDVALGGISHGDDNMMNSTRESLTDNINDNHKGLIRKLIFGLLTPGRAFLNASDSAIKGVTQKKLMMLGMYKALRQNGMTKDEALKTLNEALYGQSWEDAKKQAKEILTKYNLKVNENTITRLANDLVYGNLNTGEKINDDLISAAKNSAYHIAGIGLGHVPNNMFSKGISAMKAKSAVTESQLIKKGDWNKLAIHRMGQSIFHSTLIPFMGSQFNWIRLTAESDYGIGILSGGTNENLNSDINFDSKEKIQESIESNLRARTALARGINGLALTAVIYALLYGLAAALFSKKKNERGDELTEMDQLMFHVKDNYVLDRFMNRVSPSPFLLQYSIQTAKTPLGGGLKYGTNFFNIGNKFDKSVEMADALQLALRGKTGEAMGKLGTAMGSFGEVPFWRSYKGYYQLEQAATGHDVKSDFKTPHNFSDGVFMGGFLQDVGIYKPYSGTEVLKGIGPKKAAILEGMGIKTVEQLKGVDLHSLQNADENQLFNEKDIQTITDDLKSYP